MKKTKKFPLVIFGTGEIAELAKYYFDHDSAYEVVAFTADDSYCKTDTFKNLPLIPWSQVEKRFSPSDFNMHVALSFMKLNQLRQEKYEQVKAAGYKLASYVCSKSVTWPDLSIGDNCFILENQTIQPTCIIGNNVMMWSGNHIGHGTEIGNHTYLASHVVLSGHCKIGERCFIGVNATFRDFITIGDDCFITMDASVSRDLPSGSVALGSPAKILLSEDQRTNIIKKKYFKL
jgi:sugar O-acyltransferase (sialic acid O-acetyltransferase NeuD family)